MKNSRSNTIGRILRNKIWTGGGPRMEYRYRKSIKTNNCRELKNSGIDREKWIDRARSSEN